MSEIEKSETKSEDSNKSSVPIEFVFPEEAEYFIQSIREFHIEDIGSNKWIDNHEIIIKLSQQAALEANQYREESIKEYLIIHGKLKMLVHEAFLIMIWKTKILPKLLDIDPNPPASFLLYSILFHEASLISLLEVALYHQNGCESLGETALDLTDYCALGISQLIGLVSMGHHENSTEVSIDESILTEMERQKRDLLYKIGLRCISILNYLADKLNVLPLSVGSRMIFVHDIPCLLSDVLHLRPWLRKTNKGFEKFSEEKWKLVDSDDLLKVEKLEAQSWFCLRQLLFNQNLMSSYEINDFRQRHLGKCQGLLNETIVDQLPPLAELKHHLATLQISKNVTSNKNKLNLILEEIPQIQSKIYKKVEQAGGFTQIAAGQAEKIFLNKRDEIFELAKRLNMAYNTELLAKIEDIQNKNKETLPAEKGKCQNCKKKAEKKCANCLTAFYCSRECQVEHWSAHKSICLTQQKVAVK
ncbi:zinc finger MYND domain-containing protein 10 homolog [Condylostylus longicornis]|uniref:zinc finger MYND domain-containing protein 10 homolog n=1 Tax=Condylostylus longicornis TaxID=2530218 RepID=UPI00244DF5AE|nr:zinc finger MYND domain-containing protein 10 homolog [Condylostylus longicornis]